MGGEKIRRVDRQGSGKACTLERLGCAGWEDPCQEVGEDLSALPKRLGDKRVSRRSSSPIWEAAAGIRLRRRGKPRTQESGLNGQGEEEGAERRSVQGWVGSCAQEPSCSSRNVSQVLEVQGHVRNHSGPTEVDFIGLGC